jgi:predicted RNA binding protein YcfA (HicA-like mRNA interferase family)
LLRPISRRELIVKLRTLGFLGPRAGSKHGFMVKGTLKVRIPNPHGSDISVELLRLILRQAGITPEEWNAAR